MRLRRAVISYFVTIVVVLMTGLVSKEQAAAQQNMALQHGWEVVGNWPYGSCNTAMADGDNLYIGTGGVIIIADNKNPSAPLELSRTVTPGAVSKFFRSGDFLYVADKMGGLLIFDVRNPAKPIEVSRYSRFEPGWQEADSARDVCVSGHYAYVAMGGFNILDISDPSNPIAVAHRSDWTWDIEISSRYAYVTTTNGLQVYDISDPVNPIGLSSCLDLRCDSRVYVSNGYAYVANVDLGLFIVDMRDPFHPVEAAHLFPDWVWDVHGSGNYVYVACHDRGLRILDVSDPSRPREIGGYKDISADWEDLYIYGHYAYLTFSDGGLRIIDISDPSHPKKTHFICTSGGPNEVFVSGQYAYLANNDFNILDISDPSRPFVVGSLIPADVDGKDARAVNVSGDYAYVNGVTPHALRVLDVRDRSNPREVGTYSAPLGGTLSKGLFVSGNQAYLLGFYTGLHILDVTDPIKPVKAGCFEAPGPVDLFVSGDYAYLIYADWIDRPDHFGGLRILEITDPSNPVQVGSACIKDDCHGIFIFRGFAYVAGGHCLHVIDIHDPVYPKEVAKFEGEGVFRDVYVSGEYAYIAAAPSGLTILDIRDPFTPKEVAKLPRIEATGIFVRCEYTYVLDTYFGLTIIRNPNRPFQTLSLASTAGGTTDPPPGFHSCECGTSLTIRAVPDDKFRFMQWKGDVAGNTNPLVVMMEGEKSIKATFIRAIYPPLEFSGHEIANRSLSQSESIHILTWRANPDNENIIGYRIRRRDGASDKLIAELDPSVDRYTIRHIDHTKACEYSIVAVNSENREGDPALITIR